MDEAFGPEPHRPSDFLLIFEQLCSLVPALLTIFHVPFSIARAFNSRRFVEISPLFWLKLTVVGILSAVQINIVFQWWHLVPVGTRLARASAQAAYVGMPSLALISCLDHLYSPYGDSFLSAILSATILLDAAAFATYFYPPELGDATTPCWTFVALKLSLLVLEQFPKRRLLDRESSPNEMDNSSNYAGFWHAPLWRLAKLYLFLGFSFNLRKDFFPSMEDEARAETLYKGFLLQWEKVDKSSQLSLIKAYFHTKPDLFFAIIMPRLLEAGFTIAKPFLARDVLITISAPHVPADLAMKLIAATAVIFLGTMVSVTWAGRAKARLAWTLEQLLKAATYNKCLALAASELDAAEALAIMSKDIDNATAAITIFSCDWAVAAEVISCLIGLTSVSSIFILACLSPFIFAAKTVLDVHRMGLVDRKKWQHAAEDHIAFVSNVLSQLRDIKMLGLGSALAKVMRRYQEDEIHASAQAGMAEIFNTPGGAFVETVTPLVAVGIALLTPHALHMRSTADYAGFIGIALLLADILGTIIRMLNHRLVGIDSLRRLRDFMVKRENEDSRVYAPTRLLGSVHATPAVLSRESRPGANRRANELSEIVFQFIDASLSFEDETVLKNVSLRIPRGKVTMIVGSVGCGKSTFLRSMIGQVQLSGGSLLVASSSVAYCSQKPWIRNLSIRDNILGEKPLIRPWLNLVLYVCALDIDLARLPNGELTIAGSDGCNLSGGQKQRVAFARALYAKKEILVVDDIFAVLDKNTSSAIRIRLFGETEILSANNMTLVMSTALREHTVDADLVFEISDQGQVRERSEASREASPSYTPRRPRGAQLGTSEVSDETSDAAEDDEPPPADPVPHLYLPANAYNVPDPIWGKFNDFSLYKYFYLGPAGNLVSFIFCSVVSVAAVTEVASGVFIYFWIVTDPENRLYLLVYAGFCLGNPAFNFFCKVSYYYLVYPRTARALYSKVAESIHRATLDHLSSTDTNFLLNKFTQDVLKTTESLPRLTLPIVWGIILVGIFFITFYWASSTLVLPIGLAISELAISFFERRASHQVGILDGKPHEKLSKLTTDTSTGCEHIYAFCWQNDFLRHFYNGLNEIDQSRCRRSFLRLWCAAMSNIVAAIAAISTVTLAVTSKEPVSQIAMGFAFIAMTNFGVQINLLAICFSAADAALHGAGQIRKFIQSTPQERDPKEYEAVPLEWPDRGRIQLNCVTAQYRPFGGVRHTALDHVSFTVEPGQVVGISGRTGSGKTTLFLAILNLLEFEGSISIDNREIRGLPRDILRSRITTMTQSGLELKGTVRLNLNPFDPALRPRELLLTDDMLIGILRRVGLWERIEARGGLDAPFHRMKFSNGHKKLFHLARAMLHKQMMRTRIVLIDEGAPNAEIEDYMRQVMREVFAGCTILMVSHRPSLFREADLIITVDRGQTTTYEHSRQSDRWSVSRWSRPMD